MIVCAPLADFHARTGTGLHPCDSDAADGHTANTRHAQGQPPLNTDTRHLVALDATPHNYVQLAGFRRSPSLLAHDRNRVPCRCE